MASAKDGRKIRVHIKNNRAGAEVFRVTPARWKAACGRHAETARHIDALIDWDLDRFDRSMASADVLVTWDLPTADLARRAPALKWIHVIGAGIEHLLPLDWLPRGVTLTNSRGAHAEKAGEYGLMAILMLNSALPALMTSQRHRRWEPAFTTPLAGKTLGVVGAGCMGLAVARKARPQGLRVLGLRRGGRPARGVDQMYGPEGLHELLGRSDFVLVTTPLTPETEGLIDARALRAMKRGAGLINMARARVVDYRALAERLRGGALSGAVLDVFDPEPLPKSSPLWQTPNLVVTPHVSADDNQSYMPLVLDLLFDNLRRLLDGRPLRNRVRPALGY